MKNKSFNHLNNSCFQNQKINFTKILKNKSIFRDTTLIKKALTKGTISTKNYDLKRLSKKISLRKNEGKSLDLNGEKREIPFELANILEKGEQKFDEITNAYKSIKQENDTFSSYWDYTKKIKEKLEKVNNPDDELERNNKNNDYKKIYKMFNFSNRDKVEIDLQKNLSKKIFNSNPLLIKDNTELYFYFLNEMNETKNKSINYNDENSFRYLNKVKDFLEYIDILSDKEIDEYSKQIKLNSCNFAENQWKRMSEENIRLLQEQKKTNRKEIRESKKMIKCTKNLLHKLDKDKNYFDDPNYFTFYKNSYSKVLTPNRTIYQKVMNKSSKSDFFVAEKKHFLGKNKYGTMNILKLKKNKLSKQLNSLLNDSNNKKVRKIQSLRLNNINPLLDKNNRESFTKEYNNSSFKMKFYNSQLSNNHNISSNSMLIKKNNNIKVFPSIKSYLPYNSFTRSSQDIISNSMIQPKLNDKNYLRNKIQDSINMNTTSKEINLYSYINNETDDNIMSNNSNNIENINENNKRKSCVKDFENDKNKVKEDNKKKVIIISNLYEEVKGGKILNKEKIKDINYYIKQRGVEYKKKKNIIKNLKDVKIILDKFDINRIAKDFREAKSIENTKIIKFKKMDKKLRKLDKKYLKDIIQFKAKNIKKD